MGEIKHSIEKIGRGYRHYFLLLAGKYEVNTVINSFFNENFKLIGSAIGENAVIVRRATEGRIERELRLLYSYYSYRGTMGSVIPELINEALQDEYKPGLLLSNQHPTEFNDNGKIAYVPYSALDKAYPDKQELLSDLVRLAKSDDYAILTKTSDTSENTKKVKGYTVSLNLGVVSLGVNL
jgi:hypothetical protein